MCAVSSGISKLASLFVLFAERAAVCIQATLSNLSGTKARTRVVYGPAKLTFYNFGIRFDSLMVVLRTCCTRQGSAQGALA